MITEYAKRTADTNRWPSPSIWKGFDDSYLVRPGRAIHVFQDFDQFPVIAAGAQATVYGGWKGFASTDGSGAVADVVGGALTLSSNDDNEAASLGQLNYPFQISRSHGSLFFECRIKASTIANTTLGFFVGLIDSSTLSATVPIADDGTLADENFVGFHRLEADGDAVDAVYKANGVTQVTVDADAATLVADTYIKLGMVYDHKDNVLTFYADGVALPDTKTIPATNDGTDFPDDVRLGIVIAVKNAAGSSPGSITVDWVRCAQILDRP